MQEEMKMRKGTCRSLALALILCIATATFLSVQALELRYVGISSITSSLTISTSGAANCSGKAYLRSGYTGDLKVELKCNGTTIKTWTDSGSETLRAGGTYYVSSGYNYIVTTTVTVYNSDGAIVETPSKNSDQVSY